MNSVNDLNVSQERIAIIGAGKVGTAMGYLLRSAGYAIVAVTDRNPAAAEKCLSYTGGKLYAHPSEAANAANMILITTPDDEIAGICTTLSDTGAISPGDKVVKIGAGSLYEGAKVLVSNGLLRTAAGSGVKKTEPGTASADISGEK